MTISFYRLVVVLVASVLLCPATARAAEPPVTALAISPDGRFVVAGSQGGLVVRDWPGLVVVRRIETELEHVHDLAFAPGGRRLAVAGGAPAEEGRVEILGWPDGMRQRVLGGHDDLVYDVAFSSDGGRLVCVSLDRTMSLFNVRNGRRLRAFGGHSRGVTAVGFLPGDQRLVTASRDHSLRLWAVSDGRVIRVLDNHTAPVHALAVRPATAAGAPPWVATVAQDRTLRLWQPTIGRLVRFARLPSPPLAVGWTRDGRRVVTSCVDGHVRVVDAATVKVVVDIAALDGWGYSLAVHPAGRAAVVGGPGGRVVKVRIEDPKARPEGRGRSEVPLKNPRTASGSGSTAGGAPVRSSASSRVSRRRRDAS